MVSKPSNLAVEMLGVEKRFGDKVAVNKLDFTVKSGEIHGLVGENGAGKSTLVNVLYGFHSADAGKIRVFGRDVTLRSPADALASGVGMVHQHFMLLERLTVLENLILGAGKGLLNKDLASARKRLKEIGRDFGLVLDPDAIVEDLPVGLQQRLEIVKALYRGSKILILDEPTAVLTPQEAAGLFDMMRELKRAQVTCIIITHKLGEIMQITDNVTVMRNGSKIGSWATNKVDTKKLAELMIGRKPGKPVARKAVKANKSPLITVDNLGFRDTQKVMRLEGVSFKIRAGEILGLAGVSGNGQKWLIEILTGMRSQTYGTITVGARVFGPKDYRDASMFRDLGIAHVAEDRLQQGVVPEFTAYFNFLLGYQKHKSSPGFFINWRKIAQKAKDVMRAFDVRPLDPLLVFRQFSGGNQQKFTIARELDKNLPVLVASQPTRGVDIGSIENIHTLLIEHRNKGGSVFLNSAELDEILALADRVLVMFAGRVVGEESAKSASAQSLGLMMMNVAGKNAGKNVAKNAGKSVGKNVAKSAGKNAGKSARKSASKTTKRKPLQKQA